MSDDDDAMVHCVLRSHDAMMTGCRTAECPIVSFCVHILFSSGMSDSELLRSYCSLGSTCSTGLFTSVSLLSLSLW